MAFVLDASTTLGWYLADEGNSAAQAILQHLAEEEALVPGVWWFEVRNALLINERRGRLNASQTAEIASHLEGLPVRVEALPTSDAILELARAHRLTVYDAAYLELARRRDLPLATLDRALAGAAQAAHVPLLIAA